MTTSFVKDPDALLDYYIDWTPWLAGDTIVTSTWTVDGDVVVEDEGLVGSLATIWVSGGTVGAAVTLTNHIITTGGRAEDQSLVLVLRHK